MANQFSPADSQTYGSSPGRRPGPVLAPLGEIPARDYGSASHATRKKREMISVACGACQKRKSKCDGVRPACAGCVKKGSVCEYSADLRRNSNLRELTAKLHAQVKQYEQALHDLRSGTLSEAFVALQRIRQVDMENLTQQAQDLFDQQRNMRTDVDTPSTGRHVPETLRDSVDSGGHSPSTVASSDCLCSFDLSQHRHSEDQLDSFEDTSELRGAVSETSTATRTNPVIGASMIFATQLVQNVMVPSCRVLPLTLSGRDPYGNQYGTTYADLYQSFQLSRRELIRNDFPVAEVIGGPDVDVRALFSDEKLKEAHPISDFVVRLMRPFEWDQATKLALMHLRYRMMRWMIFPSEETWNSLPLIMKPTQAQLRIPHPIWVDFFVVPKCRDMFILQPDTRGLEWYAALDTIKMSWDGTAQQALQVEPATGEPTLSEDFLRKLDDVENLTLSQSAVAAFPQLDGNVRTRPN